MNNPLPPEKDLKVRLIEDWRWVLSKAWSVRFLALATLCQGADAGLQYIAPHQPSWPFAAASAALTAAAFVTRFLSQRDKT